MRTLLAMTLTILLWALVGLAQSTSVTEVQKLRAEILQLKIALAQAQATIADRDARLASLTLSAERDALAKDILATLKASDGDELDWSTLTLKPKGPPKE